MKNSNSSSGIKREDNWAGLDFLDFLLLLTLIMFPGGPQKEVFKAEVRKEKQVRKWNICLGADSDIHEQKTSSIAYILLGQLRMQSQHWFGYLFSASFVGFTPQLQKMTYVREKERKKEQERRNRKGKHLSPLPLLSSSFQISDGWEQDHWLSDGGRVHMIRLTPSASLQPGLSQQATHPTWLGRAHFIDFSCKHFLYVWSVSASVVISAFTATLEILLLELRVNSALFFVFLFFFL